jgi:hypothetical protein
MWRAHAWLRDPDDAIVCREPPNNWRKVYKALNVFEYCVKNGARRSPVLYSPAWLTPSATQLRGILSWTAACAPGSACGIPTPQSARAAGLWRTCVTTWTGLRTASASSTSPSPMLHILTYFTGTNLHACHAVTRASQLL